MTGVLKGVWVAYYVDYRDVVVFNNEVAALRYALAHDMHQVRFVEFGVSVRYEPEGC